MNMTLLPQLWWNFLRHEFLKCGKWEPNEDKPILTPSEHKKNFLSKVEIM